MRSLHNGENLKTFPLRSGKRQGCPFSPILFKSQPQQTDKKNKGHPREREELKLSLFADEMTQYTENPKVSTPKILELLNEFSKVS